MKNGNLKNHILLFFLDVISTFSRIILLFMSATFPLLKSHSMPWSVYLGLPFFRCTTFKHQKDRSWSEIKNSLMMFWRHAKRVIFVKIEIIQSMKQTRDTKHLKKGKHKSQERSSFKWLYSFFPESFGKIRDRYYRNS